MDGARPEIGPDESFGAPVLNGRGDTFWPAQNGYLALRRGDGRLSARWRAWSHGYQGCPRYLGYQDTQNAAWQLCQGREGYAYGKMSFDGGADIQQVDGPHLSVGPRTFRKNSCYQTPWDSSTCEDWFPAGKFIQPLLGLQNGWLYLAMEDVSYEDYIHRAGSYHADLRFRRDAGGDLVLDKHLGLCSPWDVQVFLYQGNLHLYLESQNRCLSWQGHHDQA